MFHIFNLTIETFIQLAKRFNDRKINGTIWHNCFVWALQWFILNSLVEAEIRENTHINCLRCFDGVLRFSLMCLSKHSVGEGEDMMWNDNPCTYVFPFFQPILVIFSMLFTFFFLERLSHILAKDNKILNWRPNFGFYFSFFVRSIFYIIFKPIITHI